MDLGVPKNLQTKPCSSTTCPTLTAGFIPSGPMAEGTWEGCADPYADAATNDAANYAATRLMFRDYQAAMRGCVTLS